MREGDLLITRIFIVAVLALIIVYDVATLALRGYDTTISWALYGDAQKFPIIPFALGVVAGHLFWPNLKPTKEPPR